MAFRYNFNKTSKKSISTIENLHTALGIDDNLLNEFRSLEPEEKYREIRVPKSDGKLRFVFNPHQALRAIQRRINSRIFHPKHDKGGLISWPDYLFGSIPNNPDPKNKKRKDYIACAAMHCGSKSILKMDIANFFDNIHEDHVVDLFINLLKFPDSVAKYLSGICCHNRNVIQGALTSSYIASAILFDVEPILVRKLHAKGLVYTRLVDDITVSSKHHEYNFSYAKSLIIDMLHSKGLPTNDDKTVVFGTSSGEALVHGLRVCFNEPRLPANEVARIRASVQYVERFATDPVYRTSRSYRNVYNRCLGRVNRLEQVGHNQHEILLNRLNRIKPLPNKSDIKKARKLVKKIESLYLGYKNGYRYKRLFHKAQYELNILQRTFKKTADSLRERLRKVKPNYVD